MERGPAYRNSPLEERQPPKKLPLPADLELVTKAKLHYTGRTELPCVTSEGTGITQVQSNVQRIKPGGIGHVEHFPTELQGVLLVEWHQPPLSKAGINVKDAVTPQVVAIADKASPCIFK